MLPADMQRLARPASVLEISGLGRSEDLLGSWYGTVQVMRRDETWPRWQERPMVGVCQLNLDEAPHVPSVLGDLSFITVFMAEERGTPVPPLDSPHGVGWLVRGYATLDGFAAADGPVASRVRPHAGRWMAVDADLPDWEDAVDRLEAGSEAWERYYELTDGAATGVKIGGWPALIQSSLPWGVEGHGPRHAFQLDSDPKTGINWVDGGTIYSARDPTGSPDQAWFAETQFY